VGVAGRPWLDFDGGETFPFRIDAAEEARAPFRRERAVGPHQVRFQDAVAGVDEPGAQVAVVGQQK